MSESFAEMFEESIAQTQMKPGAILTGTVVEISGDFVMVHAGLKSEGVIPVEQFFDETGNIAVSVGEVVEVALDSVEDGFGETRLSREKAKRARSWAVLEKAQETEEIVTGAITGKVKGGFTVEINDIRAFLPGSLVDVRPVRDTSYLEGKELEFKVIKLDRRRNNVVVSRRAVVESEYSAEREQLLESLQEGQEVTGIVKNLTDYGAFLDLGGIDGLLHITDMAWKRVKHPSEVVEVGQEMKVKVLKFDRERNRVSLGLKQLGDDPWAGLVHVSEMDWTNRNVNPNKVVALGDEVEVMILDIDEERRRISLGVKQCKQNPWDEFSQNFNKNDRVSGKVKSITDFGVFIGLDGGIDGLIHLSDLSWNDTGEEAVRNFQKGQEIEAIVLAVDPERERISLGVKQLEQDPFGQFVADNPKGTILKGTITEVDSKYAMVNLGDGVEGILRASEYARDRVEDLKMHLKEGEELEAKFVNIDRKARAISLSIKAKDMEEEGEAMRDYAQSSAPTATTLGDLMKEQMGQSGAVDDAAESASSEEE